MTGSAFCQSMTRWVLLLLSGTLGCQSETSSEPDISGKHFIKTIRMFDRKGNSLSDPLIIPRNKELAIRMNLEYPAGDQIPTEYKGRPVGSPENWEILVFLYKLNGEEPYRVLSFDRFLSPFNARSFGFGIVKDSQGRIISRSMLPPKTMEQGWGYWHLQYPVRDEPGEYRYEILLFPTADAPPSPGLSMTHQKLGEPVRIHEGVLIIPGIKSGK